MSAPIAAVVGAGMFHLSGACRQDRRHLSALIFLGLGALAASITLLATLDRVASTKDRSIQGRRSEKLARVEAQAAKTRAEAGLAKEESEAARECASGRGPKCLGLEQRADAARQRVSAASADIVRLGAEIAEDSMAKRLAAFLPVSEAKVSLWQPVMLPTWLDLSGLALLTFGLGYAPQRQPEPKREKAKKKRKKSARRSAVIVPFARAINDN